MMITDNNPVAASKLQKNVPEFIIYMYQMEDLIRVYNFNLPDIRQYVIHHFPVTDEEKDQMSDWFVEIMDKMKQQGIEESGHLTEVQSYKDVLLREKEILLESDENFREVYHRARPHIRESISESQGKVKSDIQACLNGIYGLLLCRISGKEVSNDVQDSLEAFGKVLGYLNYSIKNPGVGDRR